MKLRSGDLNVTVSVLFVSTMVSAMKILGNAFALLGLWEGHVRRLVNGTHLAELVKKGAVDKMDASLTCSVSLTPMGVPVPQAGRVCSAMKHATMVFMGQIVSLGAAAAMGRRVIASKDVSALQDGRDSSVREKAYQG